MRRRPSTSSPPTRSGLVYAPRAIFEWTNLQIELNAQHTTQPHESGDRALVRSTQCSRLHPKRFQHRQPHGMASVLSREFSAIGSSPRRRDFTRPGTASSPRSSRPACTSSRRACSHSKRPLSGDRNSHQTQGHPLVGASGAVSVAAVVMSGGIAGVAVIGRRRGPRRFRE